VYANLDQDKRNRSLKLLLPWCFSSPLRSSLPPLTQWRPQNTSSRDRLGTRILCKEHSRLSFIVGFLGENHQDLTQNDVSIEATGGIVPPAPQKAELVQEG
jgi:hypothetical protein